MDGPAVSDDGTTAKVIPGAVAAIDADDVDAATTALNADVGA